MLHTRNLSISNTLNSGSSNLLMQLCSYACLNKKLQSSNAARNVKFQVNQNLV